MHSYFPAFARMLSKRHLGHDNSYPAIVRANICFQLVPQLLIRATTSGTPPSRRTSDCRGNNGYYGVNIFNACHPVRPSAS
jgi:hypothetical protein